MNTLNWFDLPNAPVPGRVLCAVEDVPDSGAKLVWITPEAIADVPLGNSFGMLLLRSGPRIFAYVNRCAHFGVALSGKPEHLTFVANLSVSCNVHYAKYDWRDGHCLSGECQGAPLIAVPVRVTGERQIVIA